MTLLVVTLAVVVIASTVHGVVGLGMNLLAVPVFVVLDPALVPGPAVALGLVLSLLVAVREGTSIDRRLVWAAAGLVPGTLAALALLTVVPERSLAVPLGALVLVGVALSAVRLRLSPTRGTLAVAGVASGFLATAGSIGGPPLALVYAGSPGPQVRSNLSGFFVATGVVSLVALALSGHFSAEQVRHSLLLVPGVVVGFAVSGPLRTWADRGHTREAVLVLSALAGAGAIAQGVLS